MFASLAFVIILSVKGQPMEAMTCPIIMTAYEGGWSSTATQRIQHPAAVTSPARVSYK